MADETAFLDLVKPTGGEAVEVRVINENMDKIDANAKAVDDKLKDRANLGVVPAVASKAARDALIPAPVAGDRVFRLDMKAEEYNDGTSWWRTDGVIVPAAAQGHANCTIAADGTVLFAAVPSTAYVGADGVFTSKYRAYEITYGIYSGATQLSFRLATGGTPDTGNNYASDYAYRIANALTGATAAPANAAIITAVGASAYVGSFQLFDPAEAGRNTRIVGDGLGDNIGYEHVSRHNVAAVDDGFRINTQAAFSGWLRIRGII